MNSEQPKQPWFRETFSWNAVPYNQNHSVESSKFGLPCNNADVNIGLSAFRFQTESVTVLHVQVKKWCKIPYAAADITITLNDGSCQTEKIRDWFTESGVFCFSNKASCDQWRPDIKCDIDWYGFISEEERKNILNKKKTVPVEQLLLSPCNSDVSIHVDDQILPAHKFILAYHSPIFCATFKEMGDAYKNVALRIHNFNCETMKEVLSFLYTGKFQDEDFATWILARDVAKNYRLEKLEKYCCKKLNVVNQRNMRSG